MGIPGAFRWLADTHGNVVYFDPNIPIDNLYIDMNGVIHPQCRGLKDENQMIYAIIDYVRFLASVARPRKLLYLAIDGVAPKAKMVQQRKRRFMSVHLKAEAAKLRSKLGIPVEQDSWDTNAITPGTPFMSKLALALHQFAINPHMNLLRGIQIIISDSNIPNEGEHKIIRYIKSQFSATNISHCIHGLDADLIFLTLTCHLPKMYILREQDPGKEQRQQTSIKKRVRMQYIDLDMLRESFKTQLKLMPEYTCPVMDDWTLITFILGNDFIPHLPSLNIRYGGMDIILQLYLEILPDMPQFLCDNGQLNLKFLTALFGKLAEKQASHIEDLYRAKENHRRQMEAKHADLALIPYLYTGDSIENIQKRVREYNGAQYISYDAYWKEYEFLLDKIPDEIGWDNPDTYRDAFYKKSYGLASDDDSIRHICRDYIKILYWTTQYYFKGITAWNFAFLHHVAPLPVDIYDLLCTMTDKDVEYIKDFSAKEEQNPVSPMEQLLCVLPPQSLHLLPPQLHTIMKTRTDLYPTDIKLDMTDCVFLWESHPILPAIDLCWLSKEYERLVKPPRKFTSQHKWKK